MSTLSFPTSATVEAHILRWFQQRKIQRDVRGAKRVTATAEKPTRTSTPKIGPAISIARLSMAGHAMQRPSLAEKYLELLVQRSHYGRGFTQACHV